MRTKTISSRQRLAAFVGALLVGAGGAQAQSLPLPAPLVQAAQQAATRLAGDKPSGGSISFLGNIGGRQGDLIKAVIKPFEDATGVKVDYSASTDLLAVLQTRVLAGNPPDLAKVTRAAEATRYAAQGVLADAGAIVGVERLREMYDPGLLKAVEYNGKIVGLWDTLDNYMIWYNAKAYDGPKQPRSWAELADWAGRKSAEGKTPWCLADERGPASGAVGAGWIQAYFLKKYGPEKMAALVAGQLAWTAPEVRDAFQAYGAIATNPRMVPGGSVGVLSTSVTKMGAGLFLNPPQCSLLLGAVWAGGQTQVLYPQVRPIDDLDFFAIPGVDPAYGNTEIFSGNVVIAFNARPEVAAFLRYWSSVEAQSLLASAGYWTVANRKVPLESYGNPLLRKAGQMFINPEHALVGTPAQLGSSALTDALWRGVVQYVRNPKSLSDVLASIDAAK